MDIQLLTSLGKATSGKNHQLNMGGHAIRELLRGHQRHQHIHREAPCLPFSVSQGVQPRAEVWLRV